MDTIILTDEKLRSEFLKVYDNCADDIFEICYEQIAHRDIAKYMARNIFMRTWDLVSSTGERAENITSALYRTAKDHIKGVMDNREAQVNYSKNLWNLTLSQ